MPSPAVDIATGMTIEFLTSLWTANIEDINPTGIGAREAVPTSHQLTTKATGDDFGGRTYSPNDLAEPGTIPFTFQFNPDDPPPLNEDVEEIRLTWPEGADWQGDGFLINGIDIVGELDGKIIASATIQLSGVQNHTPAV